MDRHEPKTDWLMIGLTFAVVLLFGLLVLLVQWGNSIGYHPPSGHGRYNVGQSYFTDPPPYR